jgi:GT2 family glycosyltransferase
MKYTYSVIIVVQNINSQIAALNFLRQLPSHQKPSEILICTGKNPSIQRNIGMNLCRHSIVYFLDDDSLVPPSTPDYLLSHFHDPRTAVAGGPNLHPPDSTDFEKTVSAVLASWMGSFKVRNRYSSIGAVKEASEKDLILCNLMIRKNIFQSEGGFRTKLYPNEENEFLNRLLHKGCRLVYDPRAVIFRHRRKNIFAFCLQSFRYGRGRAQQFKVYPCMSDLIHFVPLFFSLYVMTLVGLSASHFPRLPWVLISSTFTWFIPIMLFVLLTQLTSIFAISWTRKSKDIFLIPFLIFLRHFFYGIGMIYGLICPINLRLCTVDVYRVYWKNAKPIFRRIPTK